MIKNEVQKQSEVQIHAGLSPILIMSLTLTMTLDLLTSG